MRCMETIIHFDAAESALRLDRETLLMLLDAFFSTREDYIKPIKGAIESRDAEALRSEAHRLKGAANNLRVTKIGTLAQTLEKSSSDADPSLLLSTLEQIEVSFSAGEKELSVLKSEV
ncbi:Hpt protein [Sediminispirochaeta smaragdinae DSM 11293]|uniref:Hpt protein n=2 Tax=Sediminispirochaeta TaxID=1911556 RepID=E1R8H1_SEDSS|nr:Hpt protein [Sediminispirochaeta smaragdinae DSM 11293]